MPSSSGAAAPGSPTPGTSSSSATPGTSTRSASAASGRATRTRKTCSRTSSREPSLRLDTLRDDSAFRPWIAQLTRRRCLDAISGGGREQPVDETAIEEGSADLDEVEEAFAVREAVARPLGGVPGHPRPLLRPGPELPDDLGRARHPCRDDRQPHRSLPQEAARIELEGRNEAPRGLGVDDAVYDEERLGELLRLLRPAPVAWVRAAQELPSLGARSTRSSRAPRRIVAFRAALIADLEKRARTRGLRARPSHRRRAPRTPRRELSASEPAGV